MILDEMRPWSGIAWLPSVDVAYSWQEKKREVLALGGVAALIGVFAAVDGLGSSQPDEPKQGTSVAVGKYEQTWGKPYDQTTCADFKNAMTDQQRWAMAADMLTGARTKGDGISAMPSDALVTTFRDGLSYVCVDDNLTMTDMGAGLYQTERERFGR